MAVPSKLVLYQSNDQYIEIDQLADGITGAFVNGATVTVTLKDSAGAIVTGISSLALSYVAASSGKYRGQVEDTFNPTKGGGYILHVNADNGGLKLHLEIPVEIKIRKA